LDQATTPADASSKPLSPEAVALLIEANRERNRGTFKPPLPPTSLSHLIDHPDTQYFPPSMQAQPPQPPQPGPANQ
jgi:hypothetical protein